MLMWPTASMSAAVAFALGICFLACVPGVTAAIIPIPWKVPVPSTVTRLWYTLAAIYCIVQDGLMWTQECQYRSIANWWLVKIRTQIYDQICIFGGHIGPPPPPDHCFQSSRSLFQMIPYVHKPYNSILNNSNISCDSGDMRHYRFMAAILDFCIFNLFPQQ